MDFDINLALKKSSENPFFYVGYANARICSILKDAKEKNIDICTDIKEAIDIDSKALLLKVYEFTEVLVSAALSLIHI